MTVLDLVLVLVGLLVALNLVLTVGLVRRIRDHTQQLARLSAQTVAEVALPAGAAVQVSPRRPPMAGTSNLTSWPRPSSACSPLIARRARHLSPISQSARQSRPAYRSLLS